MRQYLGTYGECDVTGTTRHAVQVSVHCHGHSHDADILPSVDILKTSTCSLFSCIQQLKKSNEPTKYVSNMNL